MEPQGRGSAEEPGIVQRHAQGCVERLRGLVDPKLPLSAPTGVQLAPASPKLVEGRFCELPLYGVLRSPLVCKFPEARVYGGYPGEAVHEGRPMLPSCSPDLTRSICTSNILPSSSNESDPIEVIETMQHDARNDAQRALYALLAGAEGCGAAARSARLAQDDELADFLCGVQDDIVGEAKRLLAQRTAE
jgi:hypothetical protein